MKRSAKPDGRQNAKNQCFTGGNRLAGRGRRLQAEISTVSANNEITKNHPPFEASKNRRFPQNTGKSIKTMGVITLCGNRRLSECDDIARGKTPEQLRKEFEALVRMIHAVLTGAKIIFLTVIPAHCPLPLFPRRRDIVPFRHSRAAA